MLIVVAGFPGAFIGMLFTGSVLIEVIFSLDGLGLLGFESVVNRDYPVVFGTLFIFTLLGLTLNIVSDVVYMLIDPRLDFARPAVFARHERWNRERGRGLGSGLDRDRGWTDVYNT